MIHVPTRVTPARCSALAVAGNVFRPAWNSSSLFLNSTGSPACAQTISRSFIRTRNRATSPSGADASQPASASIASKPYWAA